MANVSKSSITGLESIKKRMAEINAGLHGDREMDIDEANALYDEKSQLYVACFAFMPEGASYSTWLREALGDLAPRRSQIHHYYEKFLKSKSASVRPHFRVGDRCHIKGELPPGRPTRGIISKVEPIDEDNDICIIHWDDGSWGRGYSHAIEPSPFRPYRIPASVWEDMPADYRGTYTTMDDLKGYRSALMCRHGTVVVTIVTVPGQITFHINGKRWYGFDCIAIPDGWLLVNYLPGGPSQGHGNWLVSYIPEDLDSPVIGTYYQSWHDAYSRIDAANLASV